jgi:hypothetical protein
MIRIAHLYIGMGVYEKSVRYVCKAKLRPTSS